MSKKGKMLKLTVYMWTDGLPESTDCWDSGCIYVPAESRKVRGRGTLFNSSGGMGQALLKELEAAGLKVTKE